MTPEELEELLRLLRQQQQEREEFPDEAETSERMRYIIRNQHHALGPAGSQPLFAEVEMHDLGQDGGVVDSHRFYTELEDGSILHNERQLKKVGRCEVIIADEQQARICGLESLTETCSNCGRKCCRLHRVRMAGQQENPPELMEAMGRLPEAVIEQLIAGRWVCHTCLTQTQMQMKEVDKQARWQKRIQGVLRFITAIWRKDY